MNREQRQQDAVDAYFDSVDMKSIINACPRFGKIKVAIDIMKKLKVKNPLILMPRNDIAKGWEDDFIKFNLQVTPTFLTFKSIDKIVQGYDFMIIDEPHEMSINQQSKLKKHIKSSKYALGLTGTMTNKRRQQLFDNLELDVCYKYTINEAVQEGILTDYDIIIHKVPLDNNQFIHVTSKGKRYTEKGFFNLYEYIKTTSSNPSFIDLKLINIIQNSIAKARKTRDLINQVDDRVLVFCGTTNIADKLGIPVYHSKAKEKEIFTSFCDGKKYNKLATIKMMQAGVTITPINRGIINYMSGNPEDSAQKICRFLGLEYGNVDKKAKIHIICTDEDFELGRLKTGLLFFDSDKITYA